MHHPNFLLATRIFLVGESLTDNLPTDTVEFYAPEFCHGNLVARISREDYTAQIAYLARFYGATLTGRLVEDTVNEDARPSDLIESFRLRIEGADFETVYRAASALVAIARLAHGLESVARGIYGADGAGDGLRCDFTVKIANSLRAYVAGATVAA
jgi:hypothetical protein